MKKLFVILASFVLAFALSMAPAQARATGTMTYGEFSDICWSAGIACSDADTRSTVEDNCNCTGDIVSTWVGTDGANREKVSYNNTYQTGGVKINFRWGGQHWRAQQGTYCDSFGCITYPGGT